MILQNHPWVKDPLKVPDNQLYFNETENEKLIDMVSESTLQLAFKKLLFAEFCCSVKDKSYNQLEKLIKILLPFSSTYLCAVDFFHMLYFDQNILQQPWLGG